MSFHITWPNMVIFLSVVIYLIYDFFERKNILDEREELIKLKSFEFIQKVNTFTLFIFSLGYFFLKNIDGLLIISVLILSTLYTEIFSKLYYRRTL